MKVTRIAIISFLALTLANYSHTIYAAVEGTKTSSSGAALSFDQIKMAAENGDADAQYALGYMYYYGKSGAPKDNAEAKKWIGKAASQKQPQAVKALELMSKQASAANQITSTTPTTQPSSSTVQSAPSQQDQKPVAEAQKSNNYIATKTKSAPENANNANKENDLRQKIAEENQETLVDMRHQAKPIAETEKSTASENNETDTTKEVKQKPSAKISSAETSKKFTLQLLGSYHKDLALKELHAKHLSGKAHVYQTKYNNKDWYVLLYGQYSSRNEAESAAKSLEATMKQKPWVKPVSTIQTYKKLTD